MKIQIISTEYSSILLRLFKEHSIGNFSHDKEILIAPFRLRRHAEF